MVSCGMHLQDDSAGYQCSQMDNYVRIASAIVLLGWLMLYALPKPITYILSVYFVEN